MRTGIDFVERRVRAWNALEQVGELPAWGLVRRAVEETCQECPLADTASRLVCRECPLVEAVRRLIEKSKTRAGVDRG